VMAAAKTVYTKPAGTAVTTNTRTRLPWVITARPRTTARNAPTMSVAPVRPATDSRRQDRCQPSARRLRSPLR
jgi:hypothetical protein